MRIGSLAFCVIVFLVVPPPVFGASKKNQGISEASVKIERGTARRLFILGFAGQIIVTPLLSQKRSGDVIYKVTRYTDPQSPASSEEKNEILKQVVVRTSTTPDTVELRVISSLNRSDWMNWLDVKKAPQVRLEVQAPDNMNLEIYWTHGDVKVGNWNGTVNITTEEGHDSVEDVTGDVSLKTMFGSGHIENVRGNVTVDSFSSALNVSGVTGRLNLKTFSGETKLKKVVGPMVLSAQKTSVSAQDTNGVMVIQDGAAAFHIKDHHGSVVGSSDSGSIDARIQGPVTAKLTSVSGALTVHVARTSQAYVHLSTDKGSLSVPSSVESKRSSNGKSAQGRLEGNEPGSVRLTSESGDIALKFL